MKKVIVKLMIFVLALSSVMSGVSVSAASNSDINNSKVNQIEQEIDTLKNTSEISKKINVQEELQMNEDNLEMEVIKSELHETLLVKSNMVIDKANQVESNIIYNENNMEITATTSFIEDGATSSKDAYKIIISRIVGEAFEGEIINIDTGETFQINTIEASASILPALVPLILRAGLQYVIKHYGKKIAMQAMIDLAVSQITKAYGGTVKDAKNGKGKVITIPNKKQEIVIRLMEAGSGGRKDAYWRMSVGNKSVNRAGNYSSNAAETHITLQESSPATILSLIKKFKK